MHLYNKATDLFCSFYEAIKIKLHFTKLKSFYKAKPPAFLPRASPPDLMLPGPIMLFTAAI
jgi:hypothetical protein